MTFPAWGDVPTWGLFGGAVVTSVFAILAFRKQSKEVGLLQDQVETERTEREREADERRRAQAARVYVTELFSRGRPAIPDSTVPASSPSVTVTVHNTSGQPIYDLRIHWVTWDPVRQAGLEGRLGTLGPGEKVGTPRDLPPDASIGQCTTVAYFRDAAGARWTLAPTGQLEPVPADLPAGAPLIATEAASRARASLT
jgi:hypothetical protein